MHAFHSPSPVKDGRRILGEKTPNACLSPLRHATSPLKRPLGENQNPSPRKLLPSPSFAGQKRTIDQVDSSGASHVDRASVHGSMRAITPTPAGPDSTMLDDGRPSHTQHPDALDSDVPQNTPRQQPPQSPTNNTDTTEPFTPKEPTSHPAAVPEDPETRKVFIQEKANLLRNRIQSAMRHVRDPQFDRRLSELEAHSRKHPRLSWPEAAGPGPGPGSGFLQSTAAATTPVRTTHGRQPSPSSSSSFVTPRAAFHAAVQPDSNHTTEPHTSPEELPSNRNNNNSDGSETRHGLSSPPLSSGNNTQSTDPLQTPTQPDRRGAADSPMQLSSPPASASGENHGVGCAEQQSVEQKNEGSDRPEEEQQQQQEHGQRGTPSRKGDAADALLKLMNTDSQDGTDAF